MNLATRAMLFNVLLFPGWGQIYLKKYKRGILFILGVTACIFSIAWSVLQAVITILKLQPLRKGISNFGAFLQLGIDAIKSLNTFYLRGVLFFMILLWIISVIDAYLLGKKEMVKNNYPNKLI